jgi:hypothetical protein
MVQTSKPRTIDKVAALFSEPAKYPSAVIAIQSLSFTL